MGAYLLTVAGGGDLGSEWGQLGRDLRRAHTTLRLDDVNATIDAIATACAD